MVKKFLLFFLITMLVALCEDSFAQKTIISSEGTLHDKFSKKLGSLMFSASALKMGRIKNNVSKTDTIKFFNAGNKTLNLSLGKIPSHLSVKLKSPTIEANTESWIEVAYDAAKKNDYGFVLDRFELITNDSVQPKKVLTVTATLEEYFPVMTAEDSTLAPVAHWSETVFDYGKIKQGDKVTHEFVVHNNGKKDLIIHKSKTSCVCLKTTISKNTVAAGDSSMVKVEFDSFGKEGKDSRKLDVYLNDYQKSAVTIEMKGEVYK